MEKKNKTKRKCPECGGDLESETVLVSQMYKGYTFQIPEEHIYCSECDYQKKIEQRRRKTEFE